MLQVRILQSEKADLELQVQQLQKEAAASASNTSFETANSPPKSLSSSAKIVEKIGKISANLWYMLLMLFMIFEFLL